MLLILAGVAISAIVKDDGIINKADSAKKETVKGDIKERLHLAVQELTIYTLGDEITKEQLETKLAQVFTVAENSTVVEEDTKFVVTIENEVFEVSKTGGVTGGNNPSIGGDEELPEEPEDEETGITAEDILGNENIYYGKTINNYELPETNTEDITWRIFHFDGENIYLIASDYIQNVPTIDGTSNSMLLTDIYENYASNNPEKKWLNSSDSVMKWVGTDYLNSEYDNMKLVAYMLDTDLWNTLYKDTQGFAEYAIGGPTIKMYAESYNETHKNTNNIYYKGSVTQPKTRIVVTYDFANGYCVGVSPENLSHVTYALMQDEEGEIAKIYGNYDDKNSGIFVLASPSADTDSSIIITDNGGLLPCELKNYELINELNNFRPIICLSSDVSLEQVGEGDNITFNLKK